MREVRASRIPRIRGFWLAGLVTLSLLTFGIIPHASAAANAAKAPAVPVIQTVAHLDPIVLTRESQPLATTLKSPVPYGDLAFAAVLIGLTSWLFAARRRVHRSLGRLQYRPRLSRGPPLAA